MKTTSTSSGWAWTLSLATVLVLAMAAPALAASTITTANACRETSDGRLADGSAACIVNHSWIGDPSTGKWEIWRGSVGPISSGPSGSNIGFYTLYPSTTFTLSRDGIPTASATTTLHCKDASGWSTSNGACAPTSATFTGGTCTINDGEGGCLVPHSWTTTNPHEGSVSYITRDDLPGAHISDANAASNIGLWVGYPSKTFRLFHNGRELNALTSSAKCRTSSRWDAASGTCKPNAYCGNGIVEPSEQCDGGPCCNANCTFKAKTTACESDGNACTIDWCSGQSASCQHISPTSIPTYYGYFDSGDQISGIQDHANLAFVSAYCNGTGPDMGVDCPTFYSSLDEKLNAAKAANLKVALYAPGVFFNKQSAWSMLQPTSYMSRLNQLVSWLGQRGYLATVVAFFPMDEPYYNGLTKQQMESAAGATRNAWSIVKLGVIEAAPFIAAGSTFDHLPMNYDWYGTSCYSRFGCNDYSAADTLRSQIVGMNQSRSEIQRRLVLIGDFNIGKNSQSQTPTAEDQDGLVARMNKGASKSFSDPLYVALLPFIWQNLDETNVNGGTYWFGLGSRGTSLIGRAKEYGQCIRSR